MQMQGDDAYQSNDVYKKQLYLFI